MADILLSCFRILSNGVNYTIVFIQYPRVSSLDNTVFLWQTSHLTKWGCSCLNFARHAQPLRTCHLSISDTADVSQLNGN